VAQFYADKDMSKQYYQVLNAENAKGIIDPETFTQNKDQYLSKIATGRVLGMFDQHWQFSTAEQTLFQQNMIAQQYVPLPIVMNSSITPYYQDFPVLNINQGFGISVKCKDPQGVVNLFETFMSDDWQKVFQWGIEGQDYQVNSDGTFSRTDAQRQQQKDPTWKLTNKIDAFYGLMPKKQGTQAYPIGNTGNFNAGSAGEDANEFYSALNDYDKALFDHYGVKKWTDFMNPPPPNPVYYPAWTINLVDGSDAQIANQQENDLSMKYLPQAILADPSKFDSIWASYVADLQKTNIKAYEDRINSQIQWRIQNWTD